LDTILVTGGAGFIGSHLCEKVLKEGYYVINLDNFNDYYTPSIKYQNIQAASNHKNYTLIKGDIRDKHTVENIFTNFPIKKVVHLAAIAGVRKSIVNPLKYAEVDVIGTVNLLENAVKNNVEKFIFASSSSVYGNSKNIPFKENEPLDLQLSPYAAAKRAGELYCATYHHLYKLPIIILRFFTVYGPRQRPEMAINLITRLIDRKIEVPLYGDGTSKRDYTYVDDIVNGIISAINFKCCYKIFNLGNSNPVSLSKMLSIIEEKLGKKAMIKYFPIQLGDVDITYADISQAKKYLNYCPTVDLESGVKKFIDWYLMNKELYK
jgi:UDP-glucuronate 4-epimerase